MTDNGKDIFITFSKWLRNHQLHFQRVTGICYAPYCDMLPLLGNEHETGNCTTAVARQRPVKQMSGVV